MRGLSKKRYGCTPSLTEVVAPLAAEPAQPRSVGGLLHGSQRRDSVYILLPSADLPQLTACTSHFYRPFRLLICCITHKMFCLCNSGLYTHAAEI